MVVPEVTLSVAFPPLVPSAIGVISDVELLFGYTTFTVPFAVWDVVAAVASPEG